MDWTNAADIPFLWFPTPRSMNWMGHIDVMIVVDQPIMILWSGDGDSWLIGWRLGRDLESS